MGYERILYKLENAAAASKSYTFKLAVKENELKEVLILADPIRRNGLRYSGIIFGFNRRGRQQYHSKPGCYLFYNGRK